MGGAAADNGSIRKAWTTDVEVVAADAIKLTCRAREADRDVRCDERRQVGATFQIEAEVYAAGRKVTSAQPALTLDGEPLAAPSPPARPRQPPHHRLGRWPPRRARPRDRLRAAAVIAARRRPLVRG